jgi:putative transposase
MVRHHFRRGLELQWRGRLFVVERRDEDGKIQIRDTSNNDFQSLSEIMLVEELFAHNLEIIQRDGETGKIVTFVDDLSLVAEKSAEEAKRRMRYVQKFIDSKIESVTKKYLEPAIQEVAKEIQDQHPPSHITVYRWLRAYIQAGCDIRALLPRRRPGNRQRKFGKKTGLKMTQEARERARQTAQIVDDVINESYMKPRRLTVQATYDLVEARIFEENRFRTPDTKLPIPSRDSVYQLVSKIDKYEKDRARLGKRIADQKHSQRGLGPRPSRPLERAETDHTKMDAMLVDELNMLPLGRPWLTILIDKYSGMPLGRYISFEPPGSNSILQCLLHAIRPKTYLRERFPMIMQDWPTYGLPESIASDNGVEFLGKHYAEACLQLGIHIDYMPVKKPWFKSTVERFFGGQNKQLLHRLPGTTFSNIFEKGEDYDPKQHAVISFSAFVEIVDTWIVDVFSREIHRGYEQTGPRGIPVETWLEGIEKYSPAVPPKGLDLDILLRQIEYRTVDQDGIELFGLRYNTDMLALLRREVKGEKIMVRYDSSDLSLIYAADKSQGTYIPVPALDQEYTRGLSLYQHNIIKRFIRENLRRKVDREALSAAKTRIQDIVNEQFYLTKKTQTRSRAARFIGINSGKVERSVTAAVSIEDHRNFLPKPVAMLPAATAGADDASTLNDETNGVNTVNGTVTVVAESRAPKKRSGTSQKKGTETWLEVKPPGDAEANESPDLTGWEGDFNLPRK